ncbi:NhaP-type Na+/H+ or K+/H+ antiporter [Candidatus Thermokryptus mobilis]|uniref:NhaP-type Na+/H+ or K+/H+ antiporter n=1 Tax=Candidatus Thermokryptus mobilis TaxID=1643428 RepID=A0A0S4MQ41_9BACT|nr:cation:proton antiporter [Candidatus Thermokryptus mobilis]CUU01143.1 NhaP-type Na+/H+ or K+/H+ antiporter [Candidatus Thermokryptus mobilis]
MENLSLITLSILLLTAYILDLTLSRIQIPPVIILLLIGWFISQIFFLLNITDIPNFQNLLPIMGTLGLILIVLEGSFELKIERDKIKYIIRSMTSALLSVIIIIFSLSLIFHIIFQTEFKKALINTVPLSVISSSIAIPSASNLTTHLREFVIYESSLSDILGIISFNFISQAVESFDLSTIFSMLFQLLLMVLISISSTAFLISLLGKLNHPVKFIPLILMIILIYSIAKILHLPALIFILIFGLSLANFNKIHRSLNLKFVKLEEVEEEIGKFQNLVIELTFLVRSFFFLLFGYTLETKEILKPEVLLLSVVITALIIGTRYLTLKIVGEQIIPLIYIAPRGLINILLFISISPNLGIPKINQALITQVIILTNLYMVFGLIKSSREKGTQSF